MFLLPPLVVFALCGHLEAVDGRSSSHGCGQGGNSAQGGFDARFLVLVLLTKHSWGGVGGL